MMIPNMVKYPILMLPILTTAIVSGLVSALVGIHGTKESAGFGFIGMVGPINAFKFMEVDSAWLSVLLIVVAFFVVPFVTAWLADIIYRKVFRLYTNDILNSWDKDSMFLKILDQKLFNVIVNCENKV